MGCGCNDCKDPFILPVGPRGPRGYNGTGGGEGQKGNDGESIVGETGEKGDNGLGFTGGSHEPSTGITTFTSDDGLGFSTSDLRGAEGDPGDPGTPGRGYDATSSNSFAIPSIGATPSTTITSEKAYTIGARVRFTDPNNPSTKYFEGICTAYNPITGAMTTTVDLSVGSGTVSAWDVNLAGDPGTQGDKGDTGDPGTPAFDVSTPWRTPNNWTALTGFGLPPVANQLKPWIRIEGRTLFINGYFLIPLAQNGSPTTLRPDYGAKAIKYQDVYRADVQTYTGDGGYTTNDAGSITSKVPLLPVELHPNNPSITLIGRNNLAFRRLLTTESPGGETDPLNTTVLAETYFYAIHIKTDGKILITGHQDLDDSGTNQFIELNNSPIHKQISNFTDGDTVPTFIGKKIDVAEGPTTQKTSGFLTKGAWYTITNYVAGDFTLQGAPSNATGVGFYATDGFSSPTWGGSTLEKNNYVNYSSFQTYPCTFDGQDETSWGGLECDLTTSYPLNPSYTEAQILAAFDEATL